MTSEKLWRHPIDVRYLTLLSICFLCFLLSSCAGLQLVVRHLWAGQKVTGVLSPSAKAMESMQLVGAIPAFALIGLVSVVLVELSPIWHLLECVIVASNFSLMPLTIIQHAGGRVRLQLLIRESMVGHAESGSLSPSRVKEPLQLYGLPPCCCFRRWCPPKMPQPRDLPKLRLGIFQFCVLQPLFALIDVLSLEESLMGSTLRVWNGSIRESQYLIHVLRIISQLTCMSCCRGLAALVAAFNKRPEKAASLKRMVFYCQTYVMGIGLLPTLLSASILYMWGPMLLSNGEHLSGVEASVFAHAFVVCVSTLIITKASRQAFPVDRDHYPEAFPADESQRSMLSLKTVAYCPFCGSSDLQVEEGSEEAVVACSACGASGVPESLAVNFAVSSM